MVECGCFFFSFVLFCFFSVTLKIMKSINKYSTDSDFGQMLGRCISLLSFWRFERNWMQVFYWAFCDGAKGCKQVTLLSDWIVYSCAKWADPGFTSRSNGCETEGKFTIHLGNAKWGGIILPSVSCKRKSLWWGRIVLQKDHSSSKFWTGDKLKEYHKN